MNNIQSLRCDTALCLYDVLIVDSKIINGNRYRPYFPDIVKCENNDLLIAYYWNSMHVGKHKGIINMKRSTDNGWTWHFENTVIDFTDKNLDSRDAHIACLSNGELILTFFTYAWEAEHKTGNVYVSQSMDNGYTWSEPILVTEGAATSARIIEVGDNHLLLPIYKQNGNDGNNVFIVRSTDGCKTWSEPQLVDDTQGDEASALYSGDSTVYLLMRPQGNLYKSTDNGYSFEKILCAGSMHAPHFLKIHDNTFLATWCRPGAIKGNRAVEGRIFYVDKGWSTTKTKIVYSPDKYYIWDMGYPSSVQADDGRILTVYYDSSNGIIAGTYSTVEDWGLPGIIL